MLQNLDGDIVQGLYEDLEIIVRRLTEPLSNLDIITISGMGGIGKTTLARKAHDHLKIRHHFDIRVWITISQVYGSRNVLLEALHCISKQTNIEIEKDYEKKEDNELADLLWIAEGFIRSPESDKSLEEVAEDYLEDLISRNLIIVNKRRFSSQIKVCGMHDLLREFCLTEVEMTKFMHVERTDVVLTLSTQKYNGRRFSFQINSYSDDRRFKLLPSVARSIYLFSKTNNFVRPEVFSRFHLLRVLAIFDVNESFLSILPVITKLFHLRYLQVRSLAKLPASISELQNLQTLIYERSYNHATLPEKVWTMKNLRHKHTKKSCYLPSPGRKSILYKHLGMPNLVELSNLYFTSCTNEILFSIPNLKRLIVHHDDLPKQSWVNRPLTKLEALKCVSNAFLSWTPPISIKESFFPTSLKRLTFSGWFGFPWEDISTLVKLPNLEELKLIDRAAIGYVWRLRDDDIFESLKLLFRKVLLTNWVASSDNFPSLKHLVLKKCDNLKEIPIDFGEICTLESIELHNCSPSAEDSARKIEQEQEDMGNNCLKVYIHT
ncbi:hypothetical protein BC332_26855 [Capsicum chinense]|nr:hypothetical protein BC332_26855 [Capsicum chinense]